MNSHSQTRGQPHTQPLAALLDARARILTALDRDDLPLTKLPDLLGTLGKVATALAQVAGDLPPPEHPPASVILIEPHQHQLPDIVHTIGRHVVRLIELCQDAETVLVQLDHALAAYQHSAAVAARRAIRSAVRHTRQASIHPSGAEPDLTDLAPPAHYAPAEPPAAAEQ